MSLKDSSPDSSNKNIITNTKMLLFVGQSKNPDQKAISESMHQFNKIYALAIHMQQTLNGIRAHCRKLTQMHGKWISELYDGFVCFILSRRRSEY